MLVVKNLPANAGDAKDERSLDLWVGKIPWRRNDYPLQYSSLENSMDRGAWWATAHGITESDTTKQLSTHPYKQTVNWRRKLNKTDWKWRGKEEIWLSEAKFRRTE